MLGFGIGSLRSVQIAQPNPARFAPAAQTGWQTQGPPWPREGANVGTIANMPAELVTRFKNITPEGDVIELVIWKVPTPVPPTEHGYKYRAVYSVRGIRIVGFDNERGKGDHCHLDGKQHPYAFLNVDQLIEDFIAAVEARRAS